MRLFGGVTKLKRADWGRFLSRVQRLALLLEYGEVTILQEGRAIRLRPGMRGNAFHLIGW
jgi:hypothetical protein